MRVNCNISAIISNNQLGKSEDALSQAIERLSSGLKINHAEDDAAGMAISKKMHAQIKALERSSQNSQDGVSVVQTAEGALAEVENMLQRMRELAVQAADGGYGDDDRAAIQNEVEQLMDEINRVSTDTEYNTMPLLDGTLSRRAYANQDGVQMFSLSDSVAVGEYTFSVTAQATQATFQMNSFNGTVTAEQAGVLKINDASIYLEEGDDFETVLKKIVDGSDRGNADIDETNGVITLTNRAYGRYEELTVNCASDEMAALFGLASKENTAVGRDCEVTLGDGFADTASVKCVGTMFTVSDVNSFEMKIEVEGYSTYTDCVMRVTDIGALSIQVGANEGQQITLDIPKVDVHTLDLDLLNLSTIAGASAAIEKLDDAITMISTTRSKLGAYQNRLETSASSLDVYTENITAALSRIEDCDMAESMTEFTAESVKSQAATSVLAQANERPQTILQLLQ